MPIFLLILEGLKKGTVVIRFSDRLMYPSHFVPDQTSASFASQLLLPYN